jgi:hypothetical protein
VAEDEDMAGTGRGGSEQALEVRVAADDAVQHDAVGRLGVVGLLRDVVDAALHSSGQTRVEQQPRGLALIGPDSSRLTALAPPRPSSSI